LPFLHTVEGANTQDLDLLMLILAEKVTELNVNSQDKDFVRAEFGELQIVYLANQKPAFKKVHEKIFTGSTIS